MIGATALWLLYAWLASAIASSWLSDRKGYGERAGLASGLLIPVIAVVAWLAWPARPRSRWREEGPIPASLRRGRGRRRGSSG